MKTDSRSFGSKRYKALYYLLPLFNGAVVVAGHYGLRRITGGPLLDAGFPPDVAGILVSIAFFTAAVVLPGAVICILEIVALGLIYRRNVVPFALRRLRLKQDEQGNSLPVAGPLLLTFAGAIVVVTILRLSSAWIPVTGGISSTMVLFATAFFYALTVVPVLVLCEQAEGGKETDLAGESGVG